MYSLSMICDFDMICGFDVELSFFDHNKGWQPKKAEMVGKADKLLLRNYVIISHQMQNCLGIKNILVT
jgi:hypothetical protein